MGECIFCAIASGELPAQVVHETPDAIAFLDRYPAARGHVVVIPKVHAATLEALPDAAVSGLFLAVKDVMRKVTSALHPVAMNVGWNHGKDAGQHVFHLHVHVLPRQHPGGRGVQLLGEGTGHESLKGVAEAIRSA
jgi:histidine triad (HIT) family protein